MSIASNSVILQFFLALWRTVTAAWRESALCRWLDRAESSVRAWAGQSVFCRTVAREGALTRAWPDSVLRRAVAGLINLPGTLLRWLYEIARGLWDGSVAFRVLSALGRAAWLFLGLLMMVMLCAPHEKWENLYAFLAVVLITGLFLVGCMNRSRHRLQVESLGPYMTLYMGFLLYGLVASLSTALSMRFFLFHVTSLLIVLVMVSSVTKYRQLQLIVTLTGAGLLVAALFGCYQAYVGVEQLAEQLNMTINFGSEGRVYSLFDNPNNFAEILVMLIPLVLALLLNSRTFRGRFCAVVTLAASVICIGFTLSRSGWIGLTIALMLFFAFYNWRLIPVVLLVVLAAIPFLPQSIYNRILSIADTKDTSTNYRFAIYGATGTLLKHYGLQGVGLGNDVMTTVFKQFPPMYDGNYPIHTHNNYLQMWGEVGIFGLLAYLGVILGHLKAGFKAYREGTDKRVKRMLAAAVSAMCGILVISVAEYTWFYPRNMFVFWFLFAVIAVCAKLARRQEEER